MPLVIITGYPSSGKTKRANELAEFFRGRDKTVHIVSENAAIPKAGFAKNEYYSDSQKEKIVRADLKSEAIRLLTKENVVILDAGNYIKGISPSLILKKTADKLIVLNVLNRLSIWIVLCK